MENNQNDTTKDFQDEIIAELAVMMASQTEINVHEFIIASDIDVSMNKIKKFFINSSLCTEAEWKFATKQTAIKRALGFIPKNALQLVTKWIETNKIEVTYQKVMTNNVVPMFAGLPITEDARKDKQVDAIARIMENNDINEANLARDLRLKVDELKLGFSAQSIEDAVSKWFDEALRERVVQAFAHIGYDTGPRANSELGLKAWDAVATQFDLADHDAKFVIAVLKKFIWQVKRKMLSLRIDNHLMPVILGPQGVGKSTFVRDFFLGPIDEFVGNTNFKEIEETRNMDQWRNYALFLDEMGYAGKADIDNVKNKITAVTVSGRPMRTNANVQFRQNATFIGCSNKELDQLIRDETGNRRFVALRFAKKADWSLTKDIDPRHLWTSVDENGEDPTKGIADELRAAQEAVREKSQVEQWLEHYEESNPTKGKKQFSKDLYVLYSDWVQKYAPNRGMELNMFSKELSRLIKAGQAPNWTIGPKDGKNAYTLN
jgi:hypothetical protein